TPFWIKVKCRRRIRGAVCGFTAGAGGLGALILGLRSGDGWVHVGRVGSGFTDRDRREVADILMQLPGPCPFSPAPRYREKVTWVKPELDCEVEFGEWTPEGKLRAPSFKGLRPSE
ncbi:MAG: hypothetical protein HYY09_06055, partial [Firmicutes bacterium]|nr:hypothetical protein [Bacillota bacterium]